MEEKSASPRGSVHAIETERENELRFCEPVWTLAAGSGAVSLADCVTQHLGLAQAQPQHCAGACARGGCAMTKTCTQNRSRLRTMADSLFMRSL